VLRGRKLLAGMGRPELGTHRPTWYAPERLPARMLGPCAALRVDQRNDFIDAEHLPKLRRSKNESRNSSRLLLNCYTAN
jgi:hypothetical protein